MLATPVLEKVLASAAYDGLRRSAQALGTPEKDLARSVREAFDRAEERFSVEFGGRYDRPENSFLSREENWIRVLESARYSSPALQPRDLSPRGFNGEPDAPDDELEFFVRVVTEEMRAQPLLDPILATRAFRETVVGTLSAIAQNTAPRDPPAAWTHEDVLRLSAGARSALDPVLPRVPRREVRDRCLELIRGALRRGEGEVLALVGTAGYGKSTLLGELYDALAGEPPAWTGLLLCADVAVREGMTAEALAVEMGRALSGVQVPLGALCAALGRERGGGVLLIDTIDLILNEATAVPLRHVLTEAAATGTAVVFTCRDYEYDGYLAPSRGARSGRAEAFRRVEVPAFSEPEAREAARRFVERKPAERRGRQLPEEFAGRLLALSAGNEPLRLIVLHPLLLALLCELFDDALAIPSDLTTSRLYDRYWAERVVVNRLGRAVPGGTRAVVCLNIAELLFHRSSARLQIEVQQHEVSLPAAGGAEAYEGLVSEGVLRVRPATTRVGFFHQTFVEYVIARWLVDAPSEVLDGFVRSLAAPGEHPVLHWWPVLRQVLSLAEPEVMDAVLARLDLDNVAAYRAACFAAAAAERADVLHGQLLPAARQRAGGFLKALLASLEAPSSTFYDQAWRAVVQLLASGSTLAAAMQTADVAGELLVLHDRGHAARLLEALDAMGMWGRASGQREWAVVLGTFLNRLLPALDRRVEPDVLAVLRAHLDPMGIASRIAVIQLHLREGVPAAESEALLRFLLSRRIPSERGGEIEPLFTRHAPWSAPAGTALWDSWQEALYEPLPAGWARVQSLSAGRAAAARPELLDAILTELLEGDVRRLEASIGALHGTIQAGGGDAFCAALVSRDPESVPGNRASAVSRLVNSIARTLSPEQRLQVGAWLARLDAAGSRQLLQPRLALLEGPTLPAEIRDPLSALPLAERISAVTLVCLYAPAATAKMLAAWLRSQPDFDAGSLAGLQFQVALYRARARDGDPAAITGLVRLALSPYEKVAQSASAGLLEHATSDVAPTAGDLLPAAAARQVGVRTNLVLVLREQLDAGRPIPEAELTRFCQAFAGESAPPVVRALCDVIALWTIQEQRAPMALVRLIESFVARLREAGTFDGGVARAVVFVMRAAAEAAPPEDIPALAQSTRDLLRVLLKPHIERSQANLQSLLVALGRADAAFFPSVLEFAFELPERTLRVLVMAAGKVHGPGSPVLTELATADYCPAEIKRLIYDLRGA